MDRPLKWILGVTVSAGLIGLAAFAFLEGRKEVAREREREASIKVPPRLSRSTTGEVVVTLDRETQARIGLKTALAVKEAVYPEVTAYGRLIENPGASFLVRAPVAGTLRNVSSREWPRLGETFADGQPFGIVEPRLVPFERVDVGNRLTNAQADVEAAHANLDASRAAYERLKTLNANNKNVSDRSVEDAEARFKVDEARLGAARKNVAQLQSAAKSEAGGAGPVGLVARRGEVVEIFAHPNEAVESGQQILRLARFDSMLARADLPVGEVADAAITSARIVPVGHEDRPVSGERVSLAAAIDPRTLGEGYLFRVTGLGAILRPGAAITAYLQAPGKPIAGVVIPQSAVVRAVGKIWVYRQTAEDQFTRAQVSLGRSTSRGSVVTRGITAGDRIVTVGPQILLSEEQKSQIKILEENEGK